MGITRPKPKRSIKITKKILMRGLLRIQIGVLNKISVRSDINKIRRIKKKENLNSKYF